MVIIGIPCPGLIDLSKVELVTGKDRDELDDIAWQGDKITVRFNGEEKAFPTEEVLFDNCLGCECPTPQEYDILLGEPRPAAPNLTASRKNLEKLDGMSSEERWDFWKNEFSRCIRCYACRNVCPACFCKRCFVEESEPQWVLPVPRWQDNLIFQVIFIRGRPAEITNIAEKPEEEGKLIIQFEDTLVGLQRRLPVDMVVLGVGLEAQPDAEAVARLFNISRSADGFFMEKHPKLDPVATMTDGIFITGCCQGPRDIPDT
ncbi:unnamed protein product, partial [marine sediment metagenome]